METILSNARAPAMPADEPIKMDVSIEKLNKKAKMLLETRLDYEKRWREIRDTQLPFCGNFENTEDSTNKARRRDTKIYNGKAWESNQIFAGGVMSGLTPPSRQWFRLEFQSKALKDNAEAGKILDEYLEILQSVLSKSNFYNAVHSNYLELAFGQSALGIFPHPKYGVYFVAFPIGSYSLSIGADGVIDTFYHKCEMTAEQLKEKFGADNLPNDIQNAITGDNRQRKFKLNWLIEPNPNANGDKLGNRYMPYRSIYWVDGCNDKLLHQGGFHEFPVPIARYHVIGMEAYGMGPAWYCEGDVKQLQLMEKDDMLATELAVKPPIQAPASNATKDINLIPAGKNYVDADNSVRPIFQVNMDMNHIESKITLLEDRIKRAYNADLFLMLNSMENKNMTAEEVMRRQQEKLEQLGPVVQRMQFEFLSRIIERVYNILLRANILPMPEDEDLLDMLNNEEIKIEYISPLAQAQKMSGLVNIEQLLAFVGQTAQLDQSVLDKIDFPETIEWYAEKIGAPATIRRNREQFEQIQAAKQEAMQQQQQMEQAMQIAQSAAPVAQAAKNLTDAANDGNPALAEWMGM